ncbi:MAG TPA: ROK family protein [Patescibacteria group bacterium]
MKKILGIDVGGTKIAAALVDPTGNLTELKIESTSQNNLVDQLINLMVSYQGYEAIGLALPGQVLKDGTVVKLANIPAFKSTNLKELLENKFKMPVMVVNDAKAFAFAEAVYGSGKDSKCVAGVILGTGIGVGLVIDKEIYSGKDGLAGEFEHITLLDGKMLRDYRHDAGKFETAADAEKYLKILFSMIVLSFNPEIIVLGGGWSHLPGMEEILSEVTINVGGYTNKTPVVISDLKYPGLLGVALLVLNSKE